MWYSINGNFCFALFCFFFFKGGIDLSLFLGQEKKQILDGKVRGNNWWKFCQYTGREMKSRSWRERAHSSPEEGKLMLTCWVRNGQVLDRFMVQFSQVIGRQKRWEWVVELEACGTTWKFRFCMKERWTRKREGLLISVDNLSMDMEIWNILILWCCDISTMEMWRSCKPQL